MVLACISVCAATHPEAYSRYKDNPTEALPSWKDCAELDELEVAERVRVGQIRAIFEVSWHVPELAIVY